MFQRFRRGLALVVVIGWTPPASADKLVLREPAGERTVEGNVLGADSSGATLFETRDGKHLVVPKEVVVRRERSAAPLALFTRSELKVALAEEYGKDFRVTEAGHYIVVHSCSVENAREAARLLNRVQGVFTGYFLRNGNFSLSKSRQPLIAVVFESRDQYVQHVSRYLGPTAAMTLGVFIPSVNRIFLFNAFGGDAGRRVEFAAKVDPKFAKNLSSQMLEQNISTLIHEGIHQAAYNTGFHNRKVIDYPIWLVEGLAMYFENTDPNGQQGWKGGRAFNPERANRFRAAYQRGLKPGFLEEMIVDDSALRDPATAADAYGIAWTFTYYLLKNHRKEYMEYARLINERPEFTPYTRAARLADFEKAFKTPPSQMEASFLAGAVKMLEGK